MQENEERKSIGRILYLSNCIVKFKYKKDRGIVKKNIKLWNTIN